MYRDETKNLVGISKANVDFIANVSPLHGSYQLKLDIDNIKGLFTAKSDMYNNRIQLGICDLIINNVPSGVTEINLNIYFTICLWYSASPSLDENGIPTHVYDTKMMNIRNLKINEGNNEFRMGFKFVDIPDDQPEDFCIDISDSDGLYIVVDGWVV